jgi:hypothetical protein
MDTLPFCVLVLWEFVPTSLVLIYFRHIPYTRVHRFHGCEVALYNCCVQPRSGGQAGSQYGDSIQDSSSSFEPYYQQDTESPIDSHCFREDSCAFCMPSLHLLPCCVCFPCCGLAPVSAVSLSASEHNFGAAEPILDAAAEESASTAIVHRQSDSNALIVSISSLGGDMSQATLGLLQQAAPGPVNSTQFPAAGGAYRPNIQAARPNAFYGNQAHASARPAWDDQDSDGDDLPPVSLLGQVPHGAFVVGPPPGTRPQTKH